MQVTIRTDGSVRGHAPTTLLGQNLEVAGNTAPGLLSDRLTNPKFQGPANPLTGIAPGWQPGPNNNYAGLRFELTHGMSLSGEESQLIHNYAGRSSGGLVQIGRWLRAGERLRVSLWARAQHHPVTLRVGLRPLPARAPLYDSATVEVTATYWKPYQVELVSPQDDTEAVFFCYVEGEGMVWLDQIHLRPADEPLLREDILRDIRSLRVPVLRFPGGCISTNYHWRYGTGPQHLRPALRDPVFKWVMNYDFGTDEYLTLCLEQGIMPQISVNIGSGTPEEAGAWAAYCADWYRGRGLEPPPMYWQMGNEHYGAWELGNMSGEMYAQALREFVPAVKAAYPAARIIALGPETGEISPAKERLPWRQPVLDQAGDLIDLIALQIYMVGWAEDKAQGLVQALQGADKAAVTLQEAIDDCEAHGGGVRVALTEWNLWEQASHYDGKGFLEPYDVTHGLFVAAMLHHFVRLTPGLELANFYHLVNPMGIFISEGPEVKQTALAAIFRLYRPAFPGDILPVTVDATAPEGDVPAVDAICLQTAEATWLFVANRGASEAATVTCEGLTLAGEAAALVGDRPDGDFRPAAIPVQEGAITLPPLCLARLRLGAR